MQNSCKTHRQWNEYYDQLFNSPIGFQLIDIPNDNHYKIFRLYGSVIHELIAAAPDSAGFSQMFYDTYKSREQEIAYVYEHIYMPKLAVPFSIFGASVQFVNHTVEQVGRTRVVWNYFVNLFNESKRLHQVSTAVDFPSRIENSLIQTMNTQDIPDEIKSHIAEYIEILRPTYINCIDIFTNQLPTLMSHVKTMMPVLAAMKSHIRQHPDTECDMIHEYIMSQVRLLKLDSYIDDAALNLIVSQLSVMILGSLKNSIAKENMNTSQ